MAKKKLWHVLFLVIFLIFFLSKAYKVNNVLRSSEIYANDYNQTMNWLKENLDESSIILTDWKYGPNIASLAEKGTVTTTKVYPSEVSFVAERYKDASQLFFALSEDDAMDVVKKYGITHIFLAKYDFQHSTCKYLKNCDLDNATKYRTPDGKLLPDVRMSLIVTRMQDGDRFYNFRKVYDSRSFVVYQVIEPEEIQDDGFSQYKNLIENAFKNFQEIKKYDNVFGAIVPHHLTYSYQIIADLFNSIEGEYDTIIILGPDHFSSSKHKLSTSYLDWETSFGKLIPGMEVIKKLGLKSDEQAHLHEHSVRAILPFIKYRFPNAKIVPIIFNKSIGEQEATDLGKRLSKFDNTLILASIDFSHDYDLDTALKQDAEGLKVIQSFKKDEVYSLYVDSKPSLFTLLTAMEYKGAKETELLNYTNSGQLTEEYPKNVGYIAMVFRK